MFGRWTPRRLGRPSTKARATRAPTRSFHPFSASCHGIQNTPRKRAVAGQYKHQLKTTRLGARTLFTESIPSVLVPPAIFVGLLLALWTWKCFWIVVLQDKLLYLSWLPPLSRSENISDYTREFRGVQWTEKSMRSLDGTKLALCEGRFPLDPAQGHRQSQEKEKEKKKKSVVVCYFQGNGGSTPLRLPLLSQVMRAIQESSAGTGDDAEYILVALSYRGYWRSSGRATQSGIELDAQAFLDWVSGTYARPDRDLCVVLWGHSLGAAVASSAVVKGLGASLGEDAGGIVQPQIDGLVLEAPISSIKDMLVSLYPQKWLPYRYLWPFSWNNWDVAASLERMARYKMINSGNGSSNGIPVPPIFLMSAESDEVIPLSVPDHLENKAKALGLDIQRKNVKGAMHIEGPLKLDGRKALVDFIINASAGDK
ncbi:Alpha/Beta hydrolase protein [Aspergillus varians]